MNSCRNRFPFQRISQNVLPDFDLLSGFALRGLNDAGKWRRDFHRRLVGHDFHERLAAGDRVAGPDEPADEFDLNEAFADGGEGKIHSSLYHGV